MPHYRSPKDCAHNAEINHENRWIPWPGRDCHRHWTPDDPRSSGGGQHAFAEVRLHGRAHPGAFICVLPADDRRQHFALGSGYYPGDLASTTKAGLNGGYLVRYVTIADLKAMTAAARAAGATLQVQSAFRGYTTQVSTFNYWVRVDGYAKALATSARPGHSSIRWNGITSVAWAAPHHGTTPTGLRPELGPG